MHLRKLSGSRRGLLSIAVLVCLALVLLLFGVAVKTIALERQQLRAAHERMQAEFLAASGLERAAAQLAADPQYPGEVWRIDAATLSARAGAVVTIQVQSAPDRPRRRTVRAIADFPDDGPSRSRRTQQIELTLPEAGEAS